MKDKEKPKNFSERPDDPTGLRIDPLTALACQNLAMFPYPISPGMPAINPFDSVQGINGGTDSEEELSQHRKING